MFAGVYGGHFDIVSEEGEVFQRYGFVFVVADYVFHHQVGVEGLGAGEVAGEVETWGAVVGRVGYVERIRPEGSVVLLDK